MPPSKLIEGILSNSSTKVDAPVFFISDLSSLIEVAIEPITGVEVLYSLFNVILIGPITAFADWDARIADTETAKKYFFNKHNNPLIKFYKEGFRDKELQYCNTLTHHPS